MEGKGSGLKIGWVVILMCMVVLSTLVYGITKRLEHDDIVEICTLGLGFGIGVPLTVSLAFVLGRGSSHRDVSAQEPGQQVISYGGQGRMVNAGQPSIIIVPGGTYNQPQLMAPSIWEAPPSRRFTVVGSEEGLSE